jgi:hypothetical protein
VVVSVPLARWTSEQTDRIVNAHRTGAYLESLLDLFYEHIAICCKTVHGEYGAVGSTRRVNGCLFIYFFKQKKWTDKRNTLGA